MNAWEESSEISTTVTPTDLVGCRYRLVQRRRFPDLPRTRASLMRRERSDLARKAVDSQLPLRPSRGDGAGRRFSRIAISPPKPGEADTFSAELATLEALASAATIITGAVFRGSTGGVAWTVVVDVLARRPDGTYLPVMVSNHRVARPDAASTTPMIATNRLGLGEPVPSAFRLRHHTVDGYRLGLAARALAELGLDGGWGAAIGQDRSRAFLTRTEGFQEALDKALNLDLPTAPRRVKECASCRFWPLCEQELLSADDISLVFPGDRARPFREQGIETVQELIDAPLGEPSALARAWREDVPLLRRTPEITVPRADVEIDIDMEAYLDQGAYLWGAFDGSEYHHFDTWEPLGGREEAENFALFWQWLKARRRQAAEQGKSFAAYCWSAHGENHWMRMSARRFAGMRFASDVVVPSEDEVSEFISSASWVDLFGVVRRQFTGPYGLGLKVVAPQAGYTWADAEVDGEESVNARRVARGVDKQALEMRERLLRYNEDDCRATAAVRQWLSSGAPGVPGVASFS